ncbi:hypothetical protein Taro_029413 [Colocasia esculenta]|uniref:Uncharacterized protein n=1 Tax=Colocasia esculenta TaxID=4460 RepID=A0A843VT71_COLES|nr:hypothetical protein [Colocasia esculenta]
MVLHAHRLLALVVLVGFLAAQPEKACGLRSIGFVLRWTDEETAAGKSRHALEDVELDVNVDVQLAPAPLSFDLNRTSKRRVPRGSDPIHNRC